MAEAMNAETLSELLAVLLDKLGETNQMPPDTPVMMRIGGAFYDLALVRPVFGPDGVVIRVELVVAE